LPSIVLSSSFEMDAGLTGAEAVSQGGTVVRVAIANTGAIAGQRIELTWGTQTVTSAAITSADLSNGYVEVLVPTTLLTSVTPGGTNANVSVKASLVSALSGGSILAQSDPVNVMVTMPAPTIAITASASTILNGQSATITFTLSEVSQDFTSSDVSISGGTLSNFSGVSGFGDATNGYSKYTATFTSNHSSANGVISVGSAKFSDVSGYFFNGDGSDADNTLTLTNIPGALNNLRMNWEVGVTDSGFWNGDPITGGGAGRAGNLWLQGSGLTGTGLSSIQVFYYQNATQLGSVTWNGTSQTFGGNFQNTTGTTLSAKAFYNGTYYTFARGRTGTQWNTVTTIDSTSPLVIDLNGDGVQTTGLDNAVIFDLNADASLQRTGWLDRHDGFLVRDVNQNGRIDNGSELFGNRTLLTNGSEASDGWQALAQYDSNGDAVIDSQDSIFKDLQLWVDANQDGITNSGELQSLVSAQIRSLGLHAIPGQREQNGNVLEGQGRAWRSDGSSAELTDVWFTLERPAQADAIRSPGAEIREPGSQPQFVTDSITGIRGQAIPGVPPTGVNPTSTMPTPIHLDSPERGMANVPGWSDTPSAAEHHPWAPSGPGLNGTVELLASPATALPISGL
jgi:Bacterial Ig-like domain